MHDFSNKIALVTGASRGIGAAIANALGAGGATVIGTATSQKGADNISALFSDKAITGRGAILDVRDNDAVQKLVKEISSQEGAPQILVNNAGITRDNLLLRMSEEEWSDIINTDLSSVYRTSKACLRGMMKARSGRIVNISSVVGSMGNAGQSNYAAAKAGMAGFAKSMAREVGSRGITVNTVAPGYIQTDMTDALNDEQTSGLLSQIPLARMGQVADIANAVCFLCSDEAGYITGETLHVNGGMYMI
ncbi:MAG: 3-oxoacyl-ACP reductase FabG [Gammaproteobacteria bacterium]|nr:3-oxoacyl-ACP reductase FabG [Gammaproteobacteria bacterium]NNC97368.1 3-oxoacyl-ACP reductase FabG [Gammaproteobacteria bacterium]NNM13113.1 3-oxoacyl-ACP reductase FabG [Gammaproteobacteria bacterium]